MNHFTNWKIVGSISFCIGTLFLISPVQVYAEQTNANEIEISAHVSRSAIQIADPFDLNIRLIAPAGTQVSFPVTAPSLGPFEVLGNDQLLDVPLVDQVNQRSGRRLWQHRMSLETLEVGQLEIPPLEVVVALPGQQSKIRRTKPITINVVSVVEPSAELTQFQGVADVYDVQVPTPMSNRWFWLATSAVAIALGLAGGAFFLTRERKTEDAKAWAIKKLEEASDLNHAESIVRQFMEARFGFPATSLPVDQVLMELRDHGGQASLPEAEELLVKCERIKFGGLDLPAADTDRLLSLATQVVEELDRSGGQP